METVREWKNDAADRGDATDGTMEVNKVYNVHTITDQRADVPNTPALCFEYTCVEKKINIFLCGYCNFVSFHLHDLKRLACSGAEGNH